MKKFAAVIAVMALCSAPVMAAEQGGFSGPSATQSQAGGFQGPNGSVTTVESAKSLRDDTWVTLRGNIVERISDDLYVFKDASGTINVDIDHKRWNGVTVTPKFLKIHAREVSFAGQKDKHAVTEQWLCARVPGKEMPDLSAFQLEGCQVLEYARHKRKLRLGALKGNAFTLVLREVSNRDDVEQRLIDICVKGVPNYFGAQRFGIGGSNLQGAQRWAQTNTPVRDRNKRSFWLSAARSALFNQIVAERLKKADVNQVVDGDALQLAGRGSWFVATTEELAELQRRVNDKELMITAALPGSGEWGTQREALAFEQAAVAAETELQALLVREKVEAARRAMLLYPQQLSWNWWDDVTVEIRFWLPAGSFATSVVRELINTTGDYAHIAE